MESHEMFARELRKALNAKRWTASRLARQLGLNRSTTNRWLNGEKLPSDDVIHALADVLGLFGQGRQSFLLAKMGLDPDQHAYSVDTPAPPAQFLLPLDTPHHSTLPGVSRVPFRHNPLVVGRDDDLRTLVALLNIHEAVAITGIGGVGKTQIASAFAHHYGHYFPGGVFWLSFADPAGVPAEIAACGGVGYLELRPRFASLPLNEQVRLVQAAWAQPSPRLLVFDTCESEALCDQWRPKTGGCRVLLTSRRAAWDAALGVVTQQIDVLARASSVALLNAHLGLAQGRDGLDDTLNAIADMLGDLPLALQLAGKFLARYRHSVSPAAYLYRLRASAPDPLLADSLTAAPHDLLRADGFSPTGRVQSVASSIAVSYDQLEPTDPTDGCARALLRRAAQFAPSEPIPQDLLSATMAADCVTSSALARLLDLGLIDVLADGRLRLHRLLAAFARQMIDDPAALPSVAQALLNEANRLLSAGLPGPLLDIQAHLRAVADAGDNTVLTADLCASLGWHLAQIRDVPGAQHYLERALAIRRQLHDNIHTATAGVLNLLGLHQQFQTNYRESRPYFEQAIMIWEQTLGSEHSDTAAGYSNLAYSLMMWGDLGAARPLFERALAINEGFWGSEHPFTARIASNLGYLLFLQRDYTAAQPYMERAVAVRRAVLGERHPATAQSIHNLGDLYYAMSDYAAARRFHEQALAIRREIFGPQHIDTAESLFKIGQLDEAEEQYDEAVQRYTQVLAVREQIVGPTHLEVGWVAEHLGRLLARRGDNAAAKPYLERALTVYAAKFQAEHPDLRRVQHVLAAIIAEPGDSVST